MPETHDAIIACTFMMEYIRENFFLPGQVENWLIIADMENMGLLSVPFKVGFWYLLAAATH